MKHSPDQQAPHSVDAERAILGSIFLFNECFYQTDKLTAEDFYLHSHRLIYRAMLDAVDEGKPIDFVTLCDVLKDRQELETVGGVAYVTNLTDGLPHVKNISHYVERVLDQSKRRKLIQALTAAVTEAHDNGEPIAELISRTDARLMEIESNTKNDPKHIKDVLVEADEQLWADAAMAGENKASGFRTGHDSLDEMTGGYHRREVTVIAGESSDGKSALMRQGIIANACADIPQLVFSREISRERLTLDLKAFMAQVSPRHVSDGRKMDMFERERFKDINKIMSHWKVYIDDSRNLHIDELRHKARKFIKLHGVMITWIDYLQLIEGSGNNDTERMENVCKGSWNLADNEKTAVVALSQLSRLPGEKKFRPKLRRTKNASRIEQDAHTLVYVYQPEDDDGQRIASKAELIVAKQRHGPTGIIAAKFNRETLIFEER